MNGAAYLKNNFNFYSIHLIPFILLWIFANLPVSVAGAQPSSDLFKELHIEAQILTDGSLLVSETRKYEINFFRTYILVDIAHGGHPVVDLEVFLNDEPLQQFSSLPEYATNPEADDPGPGFFVHPGSPIETLSIFGRFVDTELRLQYRLEGLIQNDGGSAFMDHSFNFGAGVEFEDARTRPRSGRAITSLQLGFEQTPDQVLFARLFNSIRNVPIELKRMEEADKKIVKVAQTEARPHLKMLFSLDAVPNQQADTANVNTNPEAQDLEAEYQNWIDRIEASELRRQEAEAKLVFWRPFGWVMLLLSLFTAIARRFRKSIRKKKVKQLDFEQQLSMSDMRNLPLPVIRALNDASALQPRNHVLRLIGFALLSLGRAGFIRITSEFTPELFQNKSFSFYYGLDSIRKFTNFQIKTMIQLTDIHIIPTDKRNDEDLRPWEKTLLDHIRTAGKGEPIELKSLFPSKTRLKNLKKSGLDGAIKADEERETMKSLKETLREQFVDDLKNGYAFYEEKKGTVYINIVTLLVGFYLLGLGSPLGFLVFIVALPALIFAIVNRFERTAEGIRYQRFIRDTFKKLKKSSRITEEMESTDDVFTAFMVINYPKHYNELYNRLHPQYYYPLFSRIGVDDPHKLSSLPWIKFGPSPDDDPDRTLYLNNFILLDVCMRGLMQWSDFVGSELGSIFGSSKKDSKNNTL
ncbi:MAG: DUF2207 domain-containing protein [Balneolales bacterium]|nr:DUF2207 domain-containing protein [Balneolales bacterium]